MSSPSTPTSPDADVPLPLVSDALEAALRAIVGDAHVLASPAKLQVYECDAYTLERRPPGLVALPANTDEVAAVVRACAEHGVPIIPRGAGTSLSGGVLAVEGGVMIALTRMNRVLRVDARNRRALVEAGCVNAWISREAAPYDLLYAPDPSSQTACTIGGNVATNSGGPHTLKYGVTTNHVLGFEMVLPDGTMTWLGVTEDGGEDVDGYDLRSVVIGSEGMFGVVTRVLVRLVRRPQAWKTMLVVFESVADASGAVSDIIRAGIVPAALEMMDRGIVEAVEAAYAFGFPLDAGAVLIVELDGLAAGLATQEAEVIAHCEAHHARDVRVARSDAERLALWKCRKQAFGAVGRLSPAFLTQDGVVPRSKLPEIMAFIEACSREAGLRIVNVFHAGDGNIHPIVLYDERDPAQVRRAVHAGEAILSRCLDLGGSVSGEHGIGVEKIDFMARQFTADDLEAMRQVRRVFDPGARCNPHKLFPGSKRCGDFQVRKRASA